MQGKSRWMAQALTPVSLVALAERRNPWGVGGGILWAGNLALALA